jgi:cephalosporin hydroxylase
MNKPSDFQSEVASHIKALSADTDLQALSRIWIREITPHKYAYNFSCLGRPLIQFPQDMVALQEIVWSVKPDLIIETGIAHGGSLIQSASLLALLDYCDVSSSGGAFEPRKSKRKVLGVDIEIRPHNKAAIESHPLSHHIHMIQGSSIDASTIQKVTEFAADYKKILVLLDSNHTHHHVLEELRAYAPLTSKNSYCVVYDTLLEDIPDRYVADRPWGKGNNPKTAVLQYLDELGAMKTIAKDGDDLNFEIDREIEQKLLITVAPSGYLKRT